MDSVNTPFKDTRNADIPMVYISPRQNSDTDPSDFSDGRMCRYCFSFVLEEDDYSTCSCRTALCRSCLERELCLTEGRQDHTMKCTVCQTQYKIEYLHDSTATFINRLLFGIKETFWCKHLQIQGTRIPNIRERLALALLMLFLLLWTAATTYSIVDPGVEEFTDGISAPLIVYLFLVFMDWCVGFSMIWFVHLIGTLQLSLPFALLCVHALRMAAVLVIRFIILGTDDRWKVAGCLGMICTSLCVISACCRLHYKTSAAGHRRIQRRNVEILVNDKGPFRLKDIDRANRRNRRQSELRDDQEAQGIVPIQNVEDNS